MTVELIAPTFEVLMLRLVLLSKPEVRKHFEPSSGSCTAIHPIAVINDATGFVRLADAGLRKFLLRFIN